MKELIVHTAEGDWNIPFDGEPLIWDVLESFEETENRPLSPENRPLSPQRRPLSPFAPRRDCGGKGICGKCAVYARGATEPKPDEKGQVLACRARLTGDAEVWLSRRQTVSAIETGGEMPGWVTAGQINGLGVAADIGTTTLVLRLLDLQSGKTLATVARENPQRAVAADVIGRVDAAIHGGAGMLKSMVQGELEEMEQEVKRQAGCLDAEIAHRVVTGNTVMLSLYTGTDTEPLAHVPFRASELFGKEWENTYLPRCMGAFVGADITCAVLNSGLCSGDGPAALMDIGTNGEIALWHEGKLFCCATAAGPAFEGSGLSCGTGSVPGAINSVKIAGNGFAVTTVDGKPAVGLCGSGLTDLAAALLDLGEMDETGALESQEVRVAENVSLTQKDVRQLQLAKGAMAAGLETLLKKAGLKPSDLKRLYIAGGFGSHLDLRSAERIGLIPASVRDRVTVIGNAALIGAQMILLDPKAAEEAEKIAQTAECLNLGGDPDFSDAFTENMLFPE